jgi:glycosyltransferase involved in cell wall biosynthesis
MNTDESKRNTTMHIAFVTPELLKDEKLYPGGLSTYIFTVSQGLMEKGHRITVFLSGDKDRDLDFHGIKVIERTPKGSYILSLMEKFLKKRLPTTMDRFIRSWSINQVVKSHIKKDEIDILHYTNWKSIGFFRVDRNAIIRISSYEKLWDNNPGNVHLDKRLARYLEERSIKRFRHVIGPGDYIASYIEKDLDLPVPIEILPTPVRKYDAVIDSDFDVEGKKLILYAGTVSKIKGSELLFSIIRKYLDDHHDAMFMVAGKCGTCDGHSCSAEIGSLSSRYPGKFIYHAHMERSRLMSAFKQADAVLIPSLYDNFPNTALEALWQGAVVIASDTASLGALIRDGHNGFIMTDRDPRHWVLRLREVLYDMDASTLEKMRTHIRESLSDYEYDAAVTRLEQYYANIKNNQILQD